MLKPIWTYGIQLWGTASVSNRIRIPRFQNKCLRVVADAHPHHDNSTIDKELGMPWVSEEISRHSEIYTKRLDNHPNHVAINLLHNSHTLIRLQRKHPLDLIHQ